MFTQVFSRILDSSLRQQEAETRWLFLSMLIIGDEAGDGTVDMPVEALAARAALSEEATLRGLEVLMAPDPYSRSKAFEGRRLLPLDDNPVGPGRGWVIVNWPIYRVMANREARREQLARASKAYRLRLKEIQDMEINRHPASSRINRHQRKSSTVNRRQQASSSVSPSEAEAEAEADTEATERVPRSVAVAKRSGTEEETPSVGSLTAKGALYASATAPATSADSEAHETGQSPPQTVESTTREEPVEYPPDPTLDEQRILNRIDKTPIREWDDETTEFYLRFYPSHRKAVEERRASLREEATNADQA